MSLLQDEYKLAIDNKMLSSEVSEQDFANILKDDNMRKAYWDYCHKKDPSFYAEDYNRFSQLTAEMLNTSTPSVAANPAPTTAQEDEINMQNQKEGAAQYNVVTPAMSNQAGQQMNAEQSQVEENEEQSTLERGMQIIDDAWDKSGFFGKVFLSPMKIADLGISLVQGAASGVVEWGGRGAMSLMAQAVENNKAGDYDTFKVDAMGNPMFVPKIGANGQYEKAGYSIEEQIAAAKRVDEARAEGREADPTDVGASMYVRAANKLEKVADKLYKAALPQDISEDATFIDLIHEGEIMDAIQLSVATTGQSIPYMLLNSVGGGGLMAATLSQANTYLDLSKEHPEMEKWKRYSYAIGSAGIEQAIEKFTNPFKGLKGASNKEISRTLKEITEGAEKAVWKRVTGNVLKETAGEGGEELATSIFTDIFGTMIDVDGEYGIGLIGQYNEYAEQMREQNPSLTDKQILKTFVGQKGLEYAESFIMGALSGAYISTVSSIATRDYAKEEQKNDKVMLEAITSTADANGLSKEEVLGIVMKEKDGELTDEENSIASSFKTNYAKATMRMTAEEQGNEVVEKIANKTNGYVFEVDFADGSLGDTDMAYIVDGAVYTTDTNGKTIIDRTTSDKIVYVKVLKEDGSEEVKQVAIDELNLIGTPMQSKEFAAQYQQEMYNTAEQLFDAQQQVAGEGNVQQPLGVEGEQASNIEGRQFTNGQQTITASNPDSNGNVTLSAPITLPNGEVSERVMPQQVFNDLISGLVREEGWQEVNSQPTAQGQAQGQQVAPQPVVWGEMDAEQATATVVERSKGDKARAKKFAQKQVEVKTKALQEAQAEMDAFEGEDLDAFNAAQDKVDAAQAEVDKWTAVVNGIDAYNAPVQPRQSTQNPQQSANNSQNTLQNGNNSVPLQGEKSAEQELLDKIDSGHYPVLIFNKDNFKEVMRKNGVPEWLEESIEKQLAKLKPNQIMEGFFATGRIFIMEGMGLDVTRSKYVHERQHGLNKKSGNRVSDVMRSATRKQLVDIIENICGNDFYSYDETKDLADEFISFAMEIAYSVDTDAELEAELRKYGANEQLIQIINEINNEQRSDVNLSKARRNSVLNGIGFKNGHQNDGNQEEISNRVLEREGDGSPRPSERGDRSGRPSESSEVTQDAALEESGIQVNDETGDARFSVNYRLDAKQMDILTEQIAERVGVSKAKAKKWLKAETSLAALCLQEDNVTALYYFADGRYGAIKDNSDYPQGTVDFNNICRKRLDFTNIYLSLQREFPNKVFTAKDLETIRQIMMEDGLEVACGLCYVEDRRQLLGEIANEFRGFLKDRVIPEDLSATKKEVMQKVLDMVGDDTYIPTIAQLLEAGAYELRNSHPNIFEAFVVFNNSRGMQSGRLFEGYAEYKREILDWSDKKVKQVNDAGGLRIFSFSDFEAHHLIDIVQIISDAASKGVMIQGYTKVPEFARAVRKTRIKLNRSLIPLGDTGIQEVDGKKVLAYDTTEGIDVNSKNFLDESSNPNVGNVLEGINDEQIRMAMDDTNVDYIIPFHTGLKKDILLQKKIGAWVNYKNYQTEKDATTGSSKTADGKKVVGVNIYIDVLQAAEKEGRPIKNRKEFVEYFLKVCKERGLVPRFEQFLARGKNGEYKYTKGYEKLLVDFKMFDKRGNILPQEPVVPIFDDAFNQQIIEDYVKGTKETKEYESTKEKIRKGLNLVKFSIGNNSNTDYLNSKQKKDGRDIVGDVHFSVTRSRRKTIEGWLNKRNDLTEQEKNAFWEYIENEEPMKQLAMGRWFANGAIRLPEDQLTVDEAIKDAKKMKVDPASYASPMEIINEYRERFGKQKEEQLLSPDDARFKGILTNKVEHEHGIVVYDVQDDEVGQRAVRELMNNHLGKDFNCWCLLYADGTGEVSKSAKDYWGVYSSAKKRVAFKDGRIVSFCASSYVSTEWWDLNDISHGEVIPVEDRIADDSLGRKSMYEYNERTRESHRIGRLYRGNKKNGVYEEWYDLDPHSLAHRSYHKGGKNIRTSQSWHPNGQLKSKHTYDKEGKIDGEVVIYYSDGQLEERHEYAHGKRDGKSEYWYQDGIMSSMAYYKDGKLHGLSAEFYASGLIKDVSMIDNSEIEWSRKYHVNGTLREVSYKDKDISSLETWDKDGTITYRAKSSDSQKSMIYFKDGYVTRRAVLHKYNDSSLDIYWNGAELEIVELKKGDTVLLLLENPTPAQIEELKDIAREKCPNMLFEIERYVKSQSKPYDFFDQYGWDFGDKSIIGKVDATNEELTSVDQVRFSVVTDKKKIEELEASEKVIGYRNVVLDEDGSFRPTMATQTGNRGKGKVTNTSFRLGVWEQADEHPELVNDKGYIDLYPEEGDPTPVVYNPYIHSRKNTINSQFASAWRKPFLVFIEVEIPKTDLESGYKADKAKLALGEHEWSGGSGIVMLSRYDKPIRIVPWEEVADDWVAKYKKSGVRFNIVPPALLPILNERGVKILPPVSNSSNECKAAYEQWKAENSKPRFSISSIAEDAWNKYQYDGELESIRDVANYIEENMPKNEQTQALFDAIDAYNEEEFEDRQYYGMRGDLEPFEDAILEELETLMNSKPRFSVTAEEDKEYADAVARGDMETAQRMVIEAAKKAMPNTKIVDADGNPMIVYHDTNATELVNIETGENWNDLDWRAKDEWRKREDFDEYWEERDFYTFNNLRSRRSIEMPAYFFSTKEDEYHEYGDRTIRAFLNITNPAMDPTIENAGTYDYAGEDAMNKLIEQGHDGFIRTTNNGEWDEVNAFFPNQIKSAEPATYDDNGELIPLSERFNDDKKDIRFSLSNANQRIFVSNAERAVESIKQDKATPQQWKAMIEKQGGLKAGEDKWLGLSEWLDSKVAPAQDDETMGEAARRVAKNTITKQEILDYIDEHQIQIEEVNYTEANSSEKLERLDEYRDEYAMMVRGIEQEIEAGELEEDADVYQLAFDEMVGEYGDDFAMAFEFDWNGELQPIEDMYGNYSAADHFLSGTKAINETRMRYTTEGLENKQEIALTVPTIESWNEGDEVHFGDAGDGRAIAWIRFGETEVQTPREVIDHVDELQFAFTNVNGRDVYAPQGSKFSKDYAVYGKLANGEMGYVLYVRDKQLSAHPTLEAALEALNAHYEANPRQVTDYGKVLVIDEIQSKRHQEGREKGYATKKDRDIKRKIAKLTDQQDAIFDAMRAREEGRAGIVNFTEEETAELKRLGEEIKQLQSELSANNGIIPDAPFDKNWHELAFKRMLRYAAENGYDYVAWTTGEQQAERYDLGKQFDYIEREDNPSINGRRFALNGANYFTFVVNEEGIVTESDMSEIQGKPLADVVGKDLAIRMMSLEDGDAIEGADLRIGGEGMKGFYDKMLPSFVAKYTKKWGAKVQDINLPNLEESAQTMHAVNVTQEMKDSVMDGQVMFSVSAKEEKQYAESVAALEWLGEIEVLKSGNYWIFGDLKNKIKKSKEAKKVEKIIRAAVKEAMPNTKVVDRRGNPIVVYHGTTSTDQFNEFNEDRGIFFVKTDWIAKQYTHPRRLLWVSPSQTGRVIPAFINIENPYVVDAHYRSWENIEVPWSEETVTTDEIADYAKKNGYDGVIIEHVRDSMFKSDKNTTTEYIPFSSKQIKTTGAIYVKNKQGADEVASIFGGTYDDDGNLIPLGERFNLEKDDIHFSINRTEDLRMSPESSIFAEQYDDVPYISFDEDLDTIDSNTQSLFEERFNDVVADIEKQGANIDEALLYQKAGVIADYIEDINKEKYQVAVVPSNKDLYEWMINKGVSEELARNAQNKLNEKGGDRIRGFHQNGTIFILSQNLDSLSLAKLTYAHEIQHAKNKRNANLIIKVLDAISRREALDFISKFGKRDVYADLLNKKEEGYYTLADEVVAYAMSEGYKLGMDGNLAQYLRDKGITNEELINILNEEYERQKNDVSDSKRFFGQRDIESYRRSVARRTQQDGGDLQARSQEMGESAELETLSRGTQGDRGRIARELAEKAKDSLLRIGAKRLARKYELATTPVEHTPMFSVTGAPTPTPTETKGEYLKRYMAWRESQVDANARREFVQEMKKADGFLAKAAKKIVDRNKPIDDFQRAVVAQGGKLNVGNNAYADTTMAIGRAGYQVRRFAEHQLKNMLDAIREMMDSKLLDNIVLTWDNMDTEYTDPKNLINGKRLTVREIIGVYCQAMDVKEAKEKDLPDRGEAGFKKNLRDANGNDVSYEDVIRMVHDAVAGTTLTNQLWEAINEATKFALRYQLAAGMIDQETFDKYNRDYYVPERGWRERDLDGREEKYNESQGMTNGSPYNAALQKAKGRDSLASDPFAYIQSIAETSILSAEKNKVKQKFLQFVLDNEAIGRKTGAWNIRKVWLVEVAKDKVEVSFEKPADESKIVKGYATESQIKLASEVRQRTRAERLQHQVIVMRDGVQYIVELESEELANTLNGKYEGMNDLWEGWGNIQRTMVNYMSAINTQYNPVFPLFNLVRDFQLALISNIGEQDAKFTARFMKNIGKVQGAVWKYVANEKIMGREAFLATPMGKYLEEYFEQGAQTGFSFLRDIEALNKDIDEELTKGEFRKGAKKTKDVALGFLSMMTEWSELTVRVAQYVTARESGYSAEEAAQMAKEISVNFDRKGTESRALSKLYSFFNASIQGTNKIWRMFKHSKKAKATLLGASALYMALGILNTLMNPDDPEEDVWASDYTRKTNFLFGKVRIPVAHFFRIFYAAGVDIVRCAQGRKTVKQAIFDTANFTADELVPSSLFQIHNLWEFNEVMNKVEFNPAQYVQGAAPSWISPLTDVAMNRNYMGGKINKEPYTTTEEGMYKRGKYAMKNTDEFWIDVADLLSGGDSRAMRDFEDGQGVSGSTLQHIFEGYIGQAGKFILDAGALPIKLHEGEDISVKDIPFANRVIVPYKQESAYNQEYWELYKGLKRYEAVLKDLEKNDLDAYYKELGSQRYNDYLDLEWLVEEKPQEGDTHTPAEITKLMEANKKWREVRKPLEKTKEWRQVK